MRIAGVPLSRIGRIFSLPPGELASRVALEVRERAGRAVGRRRDRHAATFAGEEPAGPIERLVPAPPESLPRDREEDVLWLARRALEHRFDLLGSGWRPADYGADCPGLEGRRYPAEPAPAFDADGSWLRARVTASNLEEARRRWRLIDDPDYRPIDWQRDPRSGFRWRDDDWYRDARGRAPEGADIKQPWERARMQHLPLLAVAAGCARDEALTRRHARELRSQILDFAATNPPRFGVNWVCPMDVAIRVFNWLFAYDLFRATGVTFDEPFERVLVRSSMEHARHVVRHLEWRGGRRANHYLADVVGLVAAGAWLPRSRETDAWLAFGVQELEREILHQFGRDGANFEASTSYHRLSLEMAVYAVALVQGLPEERRAALAAYDHRAHVGRPGLDPAPIPLHRADDGRDLPLPAEVLERLERAGEFAWHCTSVTTGLAPLVGDDDAGRLLRLVPACRRVAPADARARYPHLESDPAFPDDGPLRLFENRDVRHVVSAVAGLRGRGDLLADAPGSRPEADFVAALAGRTPAAVPTARVALPAESVRIGDDADVSAARVRFERAPEASRQRLAIASGAPGPSLRQGLVLAAYPDFGLYVMRSSRLHLVVRCGPAGQDGNGGHAHADALSIALEIDGRPRVVDPGTYLYTPLPQRRDEYRSVRAHFAPRVAGREPAHLVAPFRLVDLMRARCCYFGDAGFCGRHEGYGVPVYRGVWLEDQAVVVEDAFEAAADQAAPVLEPLSLEPGSLLASPAYGVLERR